MQRSTNQARTALFEGARATSGVAAGGKPTSVYDDETAKMLEASNNAQQEELHKKLLMLKSVRVNVWVRFSAAASLRWAPLHASSSHVMLRHVHSAA